LDIRWELIYTDFVMGLFINGTEIAETEEVFFNGTSMDKVFFNGTEVWTEGLPAVTYTDTRRHCIDHFLFVKYNGSGKVEIAGAEPSGAVHTGRGDCGSYAQGWYTAIDQSVTGYTNIRIQVTGESMGGGGGSFDTTIPVGNSLGQQTVTVYTNGGAQTPQITTTVTLTD